MQCNIYIAMHHFRCYIGDVEQRRLEQAQCRSATIEASQVKGSDRHGRQVRHSERVPPIARMP
jgi:hypothetical protein